MDILAEDLAQVTKERDYYKEESALRIVQNRQLIEAKLQNMETMRKLIKRVAVLCLLVGVLVGAILGGLIVYLIY